MVSRRDALGLLGGGVVSMGVAAAAPAFGEAPDFSSPLPPSSRSRPPPSPPLPLSRDQQWLVGLTRGVADGIDTYPAVEGSLPLELSGTLYRNGPGLFERDGYRKSTLLDGDGLIRAFTFTGGKVRFRTRFVATEKFTREASAARFLFPTWTTPAPGFFENLPEIPRKSQAGVTAVVKNGVLYAFDEVGMPYALDPESLSTTRPVDPRGAGSQDSPRAYKAHTKTDGKTGAWVLAGTSGQPHQHLHAVVINSENGAQAHFQTPNPRGDYFHDFFWTGRHVVFHLHPTPLSPLPMLMGFRTYVDSLSWRPDLGSLLVVVDPSGSEPPVTMEVPASWMWHSVNAYERGNTIIADFVGYDAPDHFFGPHAVFRTVMTGRAGVATSPGKLRRIEIDLSQRKARLETVIGEHFEFPTVSPRVQGQPYRFGYCAIGDITRSWFHDGVAKIDVESGKYQQFRFGGKCYVGEPVFVPRQGGTAAEDAGWLLCEVLDGGAGRSDLVVFDAQSVSSGPIAKVRLLQPLPFSFHGWWQPAQRAA